MKFLCLILCQGEVCTVANDDAQFMTVQGSLVDKPNEPKIMGTVKQSKLQRVVIQLFYSMTYWATVDGPEMIAGWLSLFKLL